MHSPAAKLLQSLVRFPSLSKQEAEVADFLAGYVASSGLQVQRLDDNIYFSIGDGPDCLLLNSHLDVVPPSESHPHGAFDGAIVDGALHGRGSVDAKASVTAMTRAVVELAEAGWSPANGRLLAAFTTCEEIGGDYNGLQTLRPHLPPITSAIVGEPTEMQPCIAQKGLLILRVEAHGKTAHAARAHLGDNAIYRAGRDIAVLQSHTFARTDPFLGPPTLAVTVIEGGQTRNVVPDRCTFWVDIRSTPAYTHEDLIKELSALVESEVVVHSKRFIPVATPADARIVSACLAALPDANPFGSPTASDWIFLHDVQTVKMGPGPSERSHTPEEHIELDALDDAVNHYKAVILQYFKDT